MKTIFFFFLTVFLVSNPTTNSVIVWGMNGVADVIEASAIMVESIHYED
jgi:hypothetical protein|tara:strand:+ start:133 stop:279 length:147 start_codon:yes stop_codon:yes gene_type:complete